MQIEPMRKGACILVLVESRRARVGLCWLFLLALVLNHARHVERFDGDQIVPAYKVRGQLDRICIAGKPRTCVFVVVHAVFVSLHVTDPRCKHTGFPRLCQTQPLPL